MIIKHRRGTTREWQELDLVVIPADGELVIEECVDGVRKCKIGTGSARFSQLPYINDTTSEALLQELDTIKKELNAKVASLEESVSLEISSTEGELAKLINAKYVELANEIVIRDDAITAGLKEDINKVKAETATAINSSKADFAADQAALKTELEAKLTEAVSDIQESVGKLNASIIGEKLDRELAVGEVVKTLGAHIDNLSDKTEAAIEDLTTVFDNFTEEFTGQFEEHVSVSNSNFDEVSKNLTSLNTITSGHESQLVNITPKVEKAVNDIANLTANVDNISDKTDTNIEGLEIAFRNTIEELQSRLDKADTELQNAIDTVRQHDEQTASELSTQVSTLRKTIDEAYTFVKGLSDRFDISEEKMLDNIDQLLSTIDGLETTVDELVSSGITNLDQKFTEQVSTINNKISDLITELDKLDKSTAEKLVALEETLSGGQIVDGLRYENNELWLTSKGDQVGNSVIITGGGGGGGNVGYSIVTITNNLPSESFTAAKGSEAAINFTYTSFRNDVQTPGEGTCTVKINGENISALYGRVQHGVAKPLNVAPYLKNDLNTVEVTCMDRYGSTDTLVYTINVIELSVAVDPAFNEKQLFEGSLVLPYVLAGKIAKTLHILITDELGDEPYVYYTYNKNYAASFHNAGDTLAIDLTDCGCKHGVYKVKLFLSATLENGDDITSEPVEFNIMCKEANNTTPLLAIFYANDQATQGDDLSIPFIVYDPVKSGIERDADIKVAVYSKVNGQLIEYATKEMKAISGKAELWNTNDFPAGSVVFEVSYTYSYLSEIHVLSKFVELSIGALTLNIQPSTNSLQLFLTAQGRTNSDKVLDQWTYNDITTTFSNFNWKSNGWDPDDNGAAILRLNGDAKAIINFNPFSVDAKGLGKTLEFDFLVRDVNNRDAVVIDCIDENGRGFRATSDTAYLQSRDTKVSCRYKDQERIHVVITIEPGSTSTRFVSIYLDGILSGIQSYSADDTFAQTNSVPITLGSDECGLDFYAIRVYGRALTTNEVLKNYIASAPTVAAKRQLIKENYFGEPDEVGNIYDYKVSYAEAKKLANIPIITFTGAMPTYKGDKKKKSVYFKFEDPTNTNPTANDICYYAQDNGGKGILLDEIDVQGTSSAGYVRKNWKVKLPSKLRHIPGVIKTKTFCIKVDYAEATGTHNTGSANYVETLYDKKILNKDTADVIYGEGFIPPQKTDDKIRTTIQGFPCLIFERKDENSEYIFSSKGNFNYDKGSKETFGFTDSYAEFDPESWEFCNNTSGACNFLTELPDDWRDDFEPRYTSKLSNTFDEKEGEFINAWDRIEELREKETAPGSSLTAAEQAELTSLHESTIADFKVLHDWVVSTATKEPVWGLDEDGNEVVVGSQDIDFTNATEFETPIEIGGDIFYKDSKEYRLARFKAEFNNYFNLHYTLIYYVFTFFALMVDQRAKNLFLTRWKDEEGNAKWYPYFYDNDTIFGINNVGALTFDYYHEDSGELGTIGTMNVYNGQNSVLWNNFRESFALEIQQTYQDLRNNDKLTYDKLLNCYITEGSDKWSPAVYNEDAEYKYVSMARPYQNDKGEWVSDKGNLRQVRGPAEHHLRYFLDARLRYCDSKWNAGTYPSTDNTVTLRLNPVIQLDVLDSDNLTAEEISALNARSLSITPYSTMYAGVRFKSGTLRQELVKAGETYNFNFSEYSNDTETYLYGADNLASIGSIAHYRCSYLDLKAATKLVELKIGHRAANYDNPNLGSIEIGTKRLLRTVDLRNCSGLGVKEVNGAVQRNLDLSACPSIEHIYTEGTNLTSVTLPDGGNIKTLHLPASTESITIKNQKYLQDSAFSVAAYDRISQITIENCPLVDIKKLFTNCGGGDRLLSVRLTGINYNYDETTGISSGWYFEDASYLKNLFPRRDNNGKLVGGIVDPEDSSKDATLSGTCYIKKLSGIDYAEIKKHYPALTVEFGELTSEVTFEYYTADGTKQITTTEITAYNSNAGEITPQKLAELALEPVWSENNAFSYIFKGWSEVEQLLSTSDTTEEKYEHDIVYEQESYLKTEFADAFNGSSLKNIKGNKTIYPVFKAERQSHIITFKNATILTGDQILAQIETLYNSDADYFAAGYTTPTKQDVILPELYEFIGWDPKPEKITGPLTCYAQFKLLDSAWYHIGIHDLGKYIDYNNNEQVGHTLNSDGTIFITKYINYGNPAVLVPENIEANGKDYVVKRLGGFDNHTELNLIKLPNTLERLTREAFLKCTNLSELELPESLTSMETFALQACTKLKEIIIPAGLTNIAEAAFAQCDNLTNITVAEGNTKYIVVSNGLLDKNAGKLIHGFAQNGAVTIDDTITSLGQYCFSKLPIVSVQIPDSITTVSDNAFSDCADLVSVALPDTLQKLDAMCFFRCKKLSSITLPEALAEIASFAFRECLLSSVVIPKNVTSIGDNAFGVMSSLHTVTFKANRDANGKIIVPYIHKNAFAQSGGSEGIIFNVPWSEDYDYNYIDNVYDPESGTFTPVKIDPTGWGASKYTINYNYVEEAN